MSTLEPRQNFFEDLTSRLEQIRTQPRLNAMALVAAVILGLVAAWLHWYGLILGGMLVGVVSRTIALALAGAIGFGVVVLAVFALTLGGDLGAVAAMAPAIYLTVGSAFALPLLGALIRGVV